MYHVEAHTRGGVYASVLSQLFQEYEEAEKWVRKLLYAGYKVTITAHV